jgi:hypothetical protein
MLLILAQSCESLRTSTVRSVWYSSYIYTYYADAVTLENGTPSMMIPTTTPANPKAYYAFKLKSPSIIAVTLTRLNAATIPNWHHIDWLDPDGYYYRIPPSSYSYNDAGSQSATYVLAPGLYSMVISPNFRAEETYSYVMSVVAHALPKFTPKISPVSFLVCRKRSHLQIRDIRNL